MSAKKEQKSRLKLVVRCLPAQLSESTFQSSIEKFNDLIDFYYFVPGKITEKKNVNARAYLGFTSPEGLNQFFNFFNGHIFVTNKGKEQKAIVEYAPFQKVANKSKKRATDAREGTIETDEDYLKFLEELKTPVVSLPSAEEQLDKRLADKDGPGSMPTTTPLLEYLKVKRAQKEKAREERLERRKRNNKDKKEGPKKPVGEVKKKEKPNRKKEREEKRKKRKDGGERKDGEQTAEKEGEGKRGKNGVWIIRKQTEPGLISIQTREATSTPEPAAAENQNLSEAPQGGVNPKPQRRPPSAGNLGNKPPSRRAPRSEGPRTKVYAPKQAPSPIAVKNGP